VPSPLYLDHLSTTPIDPRVVDAMLPWLREHFGHPASRGHAYGWAAEKGLEIARAQVADLIGAEPAEIVFTSGGAESDNLAVKGLAEALSAKGRHVVTSAIENRPVLDSCTWLERRGFTVTRVAPDPSGRVAAGAIEEAITEETVLVSLQAANHEVGTRQPLDEVGRICKERAVIFHVNAVHALAWMAIDVKASGIHLLSMSGDKLYGPKGIGALFVNRRRPRVRLAAQIHGGGHERGMRSGTPNVAGAVGLGIAADLCRTERDADSQRVRQLRDGFENALVEGGAPARLLGNPAHRLPNVASIRFEGVEGEALVTALPLVAFATGSACTSATQEPSTVLRAMGLTSEALSETVRFSMGRTTAGDALEQAVPRIVDAVARLRASNPRFAG
jgi:cysteine desulfurase